MRRSKQQPNPIIRAGALWGQGIIASCSILEFWRCEDRPGSQELQDMTARWRCRGCAAGFLANRVSPCDQPLPRGRKEQVVFQPDTGLWGSSPGGDLILRVVRHYVIPDDRIVDSIGDSLHTALFW